MALSSNYILTSNGVFLSESELYHHGIKGMKWGVRRYQNKDGSLTDAGRTRYLNPEGTLKEAGRKIYMNKDGSLTKAGRKLSQNPDGSLTLIGEAHLREKAGSYLNAPREYDKRNKKITNESATRNRRAVGKAFVLAEMRDIDENYDPVVTTREQDKRWNFFLDAYASATLEDLNYSYSDKAKEFVKGLFEDYLLYDYDYTYTSRDGTKQTGTLTANGRDDTSITGEKFRNKRLIKWYE